MAMPSQRLSEISHSFDGVLELPDGRQFPCDIVLRLPTNAAADAFLDARVRGVNAHGLTTHGVKLRSTTQTEAAGLHFVAEGAHIREAWSGLGTSMGNSAGIDFAFIPSWQVQTAVSGSPGPVLTPQTVVQTAYALLSPLQYGSPNPKFLGKATGERVLVQKDSCRQLRFKTESGTSAAWELDVHWMWTRQAGEAHRVDGNAVLRLNGELIVAQLESASEDACIFLSLAARHRVVVQTAVAFHGGRHLEMWNQPLERQRGVGNEESDGHLVGESELEAFFERAHSWWSQLSSSQRDAARLAVFAINPLVRTTLEQEFTAKHFALEGLLTRWGQGKKTATDQLDAILGFAPSTLSELWQVGGADSERPIRWLRNELSHGRQNLTRLTEYVSAANDHLTVWLELVLLALIGFQRTETTQDKLRKVLRQNAVRLTALLAQLRAL
jgi:hypothetical protein